ncbi:hypothetical protein H4Q26_008856 [Puccinia striiformis f. sp. tritici PST-130]|nr:hypothetical protein H4Q26_008856 [Puccinia striiformis f. sp. tritici PST-130]
MQLELKLHPDTQALGSLKVVRTTREDNQIISNIEILSISYREVPLICTLAWAVEALPDGGLRKGYSRPQENPDDGNSEAVYIPSPCACTSIHQYVRSVPQGMLYITTTTSSITSQWLAVDEQRRSASVTSQLLVNEQQPSASVTSQLLVDEQRPYVSVTSQLLVNEQQPYVSVTSQLLVNEQQPYVSVTRQLLVDEQRPYVSVTSQLLVDEQRPSVSEINEKNN